MVNQLIIGAIWVKIALSQHNWLSPLIFPVTLCDTPKTNTSDSGVAEVTGPYPEFFYFILFYLFIYLFFFFLGGGLFSQNWTFSSINVIAYIDIYKVKYLKMLF